MFNSEQKIICLTRKKDFMLKTSPKPPRNLDDICQIFFFPIFYIKPSNNFKGQLRTFTRNHIVSQMMQFCFSKHMFLFWLTWNASSLCRLLCIHLQLLRSLLRAFSKWCSLVTLSQPPGRTPILRNIWHVFVISFPVLELRSLTAWDEHHLVLGVQ